MVVELQLVFQDRLSEDPDPLEFTHTLTAPADFEITGGQIFVENPETHELQRFNFRIDRDSETQEAKLVVLEDVKA